MLRGLTETFKARDTNMNGNITVTYEDFMCMVLLNKPWFNATVYHSNYSFVLGKAKFILTCPFCKKIIIFQ